jgi:hypothetical protein
MAAVIADSPAQIENANEVVKMLGQLGLPTVRHVASPSATPGFVLQLAQQLEASFARLILIAVGDNDLLRSMLDATSSAPVLDGTLEPQQLAMQCAKLLGLEDTVLYGRTLLMQANARSSVIHADASLQQQVPTPNGAALG